MKVSINNKEVETDAVTLLQLTTELSLPAQGVAVAAITHHMSLHTIAHEQVTHLWLQVHLLGIRILSYRHTYSSDRKSVV